MPAQSMELRSQGPGAYWWGGPRVYCLRRLDRNLEYGTSSIKSTPFVLLIRSLHVRIGEMLFEYSFSVQDPLVKLVAVRR